LAASFTHHGQKLGAGVLAARSVNISVSSRLNSKQASAVLKEFDEVKLQEWVI
jgi:hypothetical protein